MHSRGKLRAASLAASVSALALFPSPASSQAAADPPSNILTDENGVDLSSGTIHYQLQHQLPSIQPGLPPYMRYWMSGWRDTMTMTLKTISPYTDATVAIGTYSEHFMGTDGQHFTSAKNAGSTLLRDPATGYFYFTDSKGTVFRFDPHPFDTGNPGLGITARAGLITFPSGATANLTYQVYTACATPCMIPSIVARLQNVSASNGFSYKFQYAADAQTYGGIQQYLRLTKVTRYNKATEYCDPSANACSFVNAWPSIQYGETQVSNQWTETETDAGGNTAQFVRLTRNGLLSTRRAASSTNTMTVVWNNEYVGQVIRDGRTWTYNFVQACCGGPGMTTTVTKPSGGQIIVVADTRNGTPTSMRDELGGMTYYTFDTGQNLTRVVYPNGRSVNYTYDARGNRTSSTAISSTPGTPADLVTTWVYPGTCSNPLTCNHPTSVIDPRGNSTDYTYDSTHGGVLTETKPAPTVGAVRPQRRTQYVQVQAFIKDASGAIGPSGVPTYMSSVVSECRTSTSCAGTADERRATIDYGPQISGTPNNLLPAAMTIASGDGAIVATTTNTYDQNGWRLTDDGPLAGTADTTRYRYNAVGWVVGQAGPDPDGGGPLHNRAVRTTFDADGQPTLLEQGTVTDQSDAAWSAFTSLVQHSIVYDSAGRKGQESVASGGTTLTMKQYSYDSAGRPECDTVRMNPAVFGSLPASACTLSTSGAYGSDRVTKQLYDLLGRPTQVIRALGTADQATDRAMTYTPNGMVSAITDGENNTTTFAYDGQDRVTTLYFPSPTKGSGTSDATNYEQLSYDANGNLVSKRLRDGNSIAYAYDALDRVTTKTLPGLATYEFPITYAYDNFGHITQAADTNGHVMTFGWDAPGRNTSKTSNFFSYTSTYDLAGRRTRLTHGDGFYVDYDYYVTGDVAAIRENGATSGVGVLATFAYDDFGRRASVTFGDGSATIYSYDGISRLLSKTIDLAGTSYDLTLGYSYNPAGQIIQSTRSNDAYAWGGHGSGTTGTTVNGLNELLAVGPTGATYDSRGNLTSAGPTVYGFTSENKMASAAGNLFAYDPLGRMHYNQTAGLVLQYDGDELAVELTGTTVARRYVFGPTTDEPLVWYEGSGTADRRFLHADDQGTIVAVTGSTGSVLGVNTYDEYGKSSASNIGRFQYTGQAYIPEAGVYDFKYRAYATGLGRFMQTDPAGYKGGMNLYEYAGDDPINAGDPLGMMCLWRAKDGSCIVKLPKNPTEDEKRAAQELADRLTKWDKQVQMIPDNAKIPVVDGNGKPTGETVSGSDFKWAWNHTGTRIVRVAPNNGGAGGGTGGTFDATGRLIKGESMLTLKVIADYRMAAIFGGRLPEEGEDTLIFHEISHNTTLGHTYSVTTPAHAGLFNAADWARERHTSNIGHSVLDSVGGHYVCYVTKCD